MSTRNWCDTCRGDGSTFDALFRCTSCPRRFHKECAGLRTNPSNGWECPYCVSEEDTGGNDDGSDTKSSRKEKNKVKKRIASVRKYHKELKDNSKSYLSENKSNLKPFVSSNWYESMTTGGRAKDGNNTTVTTTLPFQIGKSPKFVNAVLRSYQVEGVNWLLSRYNLGTGCIVADEMGLGKTIQSLSFIAALKNEGLPGPHLVVTPLAVLQNWANEIKRFTPGLSHIKIHGSMSERDRLLSRDDVLGGEFDVYLTT